MTRIASARAKMSNTGWTTLAKARSYMHTGLKSASANTFESHTILVSCKKCDTTSATRVRKTIFRRRLKHTKHYFCNTCATRNRCQFDQLKERFGRTCNGTRKLGTCTVVCAPGIRPRIRVLQINVTQYYNYLKIDELLCSTYTLRTFNYLAVDCFLV